MILPIIIRAENSLGASYELKTIKITLKDMISLIIIRTQNNLRTSKYIVNHPINIY